RSAVPRPLPARSVGVGRRPGGSIGRAGLPWKIQAQRLSVSDTRSDGKRPENTAKLTSLETHNFYPPTFGAPMLEGSGGIGALRNPNRSPDPIGSPHDGSGSIIDPSLRTVDRRFIP